MDHVESHFDVVCNETVCTPGICNEVVFASPVKVQAVRARAEESEVRGRVAMRFDLKAIYAARKTDYESRLRGHGRDGGVRWTPSDRSGNMTRGGPAPRRSWQAVCLLPQRCKEER